MAANIGITQVIHVAGEDNKNCHLLSRNGPHLTVTVEEEARFMGIEGARTVEVNGEESVKKILRLFDPQRVLTTEEDFIRFWPEVRAALAEFLHPHNTHNLRIKTRRGKD